MKNSELYYKTVDILVQAYFDDTLIAGNCCACAVGNIVAANCGYIIKLHKNHEEDAAPWQKASWYSKERLLPYPANGLTKEIVLGWGAAIATNWGEQEIIRDNYIGPAKKQIDSTGYSFDEVARIEWAFETAHTNSGDDMFDRLCAVIDALDIIHENTDSTVTEENKAKFKRPSLVEV